ncbi:zinc metalloprotease [Aquimarina sp. U1-2]|uniref:zinc metalloprotease n=1 Tax=Aquimarina sp. U1-2 TaxID=2823141 RepID=UPI001AECF0B7|nr:zinc metalloprotease [Aquimarina sp. U1-2]MBP2831137.1 zinc metalloprotease [Aquimarina sp. U1-2]
MRKITILFVFSSFLCIFLYSCGNSKKEKREEHTISDETRNPINNIPDSIIRCGTMQVLQDHLIKNPELKERMKAIENHCRAFVQLRKNENVQRLDTIIIPTVVHIVYNNENENISDEQVRSQIQVLNEDFTKSNTDSNQVPQEFLIVATNTKIHFELDSIIRVASARATWGTNDQVKFASNGGSDVIDPSKNLNIWVCTIGGGILGYAQFPGDNAETDGIVVSPQYFGTTGFVTAPFNKGRTTTHEVGHWLNLRHIWGDGNCALDDFVDDTPLSDGPNYGCPTYPTVRCNSTDMTMNYMDYSNDACMHMFTIGQKNRMRAVFAEGGPRESFVKTIIP